MTEPTNQYFEHTTRQEADTLARSAAINQNFDAVQTAFGKLPAPELLQTDTVSFGVATGPANEYKLTLPITPAAYTQSMEAMFVVPAGEGNTGPATLNVLGPNATYLGAVAIKRADGTDLVAGDMPAGSIALMRKTATYWQIFAAHGDLAATRQAAIEAAASKDSAATSAITSTSGATTSTTKASEASTSAANALQSEENAAESETNAADSATAAAQSADTAVAAKNDAETAAQAALNAEEYEGNAQAHAAAAAQSEANAAGSEAAAALSASQLANSLIQRPIVSADYTAQNGDRMAVQATVPVTITAPADPEADWFFSVFDKSNDAATNNITIDFGAAGYEGNSETFIIDVNSFEAGFIFDGATWRRCE